ncbi:MAG: right-handed parallel beta-helix repeat-containing protein [Caldilineaceae bacterium]
MAAKTTDGSPRQTTASFAPITTRIVTNTADTEDAGTLRRALLDAQIRDLIQFDAQCLYPLTPLRLRLPPNCRSLKHGTFNRRQQCRRGARWRYRHPGASGIVVSGAMSVTIRGLQIVNFPSHGIELIAGARYAIIGGNRLEGAAILGQGNLISGNGDSAILIRDAGALPGNRILGNFIGVTPDGKIALPNGTGVLSLMASTEPIGAACALP